MASKMTTAKEIVAQIVPWLEKGLEFPTIWTPCLQENAPTLRKQVHRELAKRGCDRVHISFNDNKLYISMRKPDRKQLIAMIRRLMLSCENERLYDEALELVKTN